MQLVQLDKAERKKPQGTPIKGTTEVGEHHENTEINPPSPQRKWATPLDFHRMSYMCVPVVRIIEISNDRPLQNTLLCVQRVVKDWLRVS